MGVTAIVGANWGDEGKGKLVDHLASQGEFVVRFQGGRNAGHTVINSWGKFALHMLPSGVFYPQVTNVLGPGVGLDLAQFFKELDELAAHGLRPRVLVSERAQVVLPYHSLFDTLEEERLGARSFGSTRSGIAPFYADKVLKVGVQVADLLDRERALERISAALEAKNLVLREFYGHPVLEARQVLAELEPYMERLLPLVTDTTSLLRQAWQEGRGMILEGQLGALRDPDHGIYPFTTSSSTLAGYASVGAGLPPQAISQVLAVVKAYSSCVGAGPFVTELSGSQAHELRERGGSEGEYGATTGRPRRVGWLDLVATRYGVQLQGATGLALTLFDVLGYLDEIPVCVGYEVDGVVTRSFPVTSALGRVRPIYRVFPGWGSDISGVRRMGDLPGQAQEYVRFIQEYLEVPVRYLAVGPHREQLIEV